MVKFSTRLQYSFADSNQRNVIRPFAALRDAGNSLNTAQNLGTLRRNSTRSSGTVGAADQDFFRFKVDQTTAFSARLRNSSRRNQPIAVTILNRRGQAVELNQSFLFRNVAAGATDTITVNGLPKGEYFVRLQSVNGRNEAYDLELSRTTLPGGNNQGDTQNLGTLIRGRDYRYEGIVGGSDIDAYRFNLDSNSRLTTTLFNSSNDPIAVSLLDRNSQVVQTTSGRFLFGNAEPGATVELFAPTLAAGEYRLRVQSAVGTQESYQLQLRRSFLDSVPI
jgi:hypothetical protein